MSTFTPTFVAAPVALRPTSTQSLATTATSASAFTPLSHPLSPAPRAARLHAAPSPARPLAPTMALPKTAIITGASSSIGLAAAAELVRRGDTHVVMAVRDVAKGEREASAAGFPEGSFTVMPLDLSRLDSVRDFVNAYRIEGFRALNALVCNAAIWYPKDKKARVTADGFDETVQVNHLGHFLLANLLLSDLNFAKGRLVFLATQTHNPDTLPGKIPPQADLGELEGMASGFKSGNMTIDGKKFEPTKAYKDSKVCNVLTMTEMHRRFGTNGVVVNAIFPGCIAESNLFREKRGWFRWFFPIFQKYITKQFVSVEEAGRRVACVASDGEFGDSGKYWQWRGSYVEGSEKTKPVSIMPTEREVKNAEKLWDISCELVGLPSSVPVKSY